MLQFQGNVEDGERYAWVPGAACQDDADDGHQQDDVGAAFEADRRFGSRIAPAVTFLAVPVAVESVEQREQDDDAEQHLAEQMLGRPEEAHTFQEAQEQRWIAEWRQGTADVRHQKDEEHEDMDLVSPVVVGADDRPDQQHRRAGGTHPAGQHGADREQGRVHRRRTVEVAADMDAARDDEQGSKQHDEGDVVQQC